MPWCPPDDQCGAVDVLSEKGGGGDGWKQPLWQSSLVDGGEGQQPVWHRAKSKLWSWSCFLRWCLYFTLVDAWAKIIQKYSMIVNKTSTHYSGTTIRKTNCGMLLNIWDVWIGLLIAESLNYFIMSVLQVQDCGTSLSTCPSNSSHQNPSSSSKTSQSRTSSRSSSTASASSSSNPVPKKTFAHRVFRSSKTVINRAFPLKTNVTPRVKRLRSWATCLEEHP